MFSRGALFGISATAFFSLLFFFCPSLRSQAPPADNNLYLGFDLNEYPGDAALPVLRATFSFASYWLGPAPGEKRTTWVGKRALMQEQHFGFVLLYNARETRAVKNDTSAREKGLLDAQTAAAAAGREGFPAGSVIFLDVEEGGRLPDSYHTYLATWTDELARLGFRTGFYCSGISVDEGHGVSIKTAQDIQAHLAPREVAFWVYNDVCPPAPGCALTVAGLKMADSGFPAATIWQFAQSPRRKVYTAHCAKTYASDGNCYVAGDTGHKWFLDLNASVSPDPSAPTK